MISILSVETVQLQEWNRDATTEDAPSSRYTEQRRPPMHMPLSSIGDRSAASPPPDLRNTLALRFETASVVMLATVAALAVAVLAAWGLDVALLRRVAPLFGSMNVNTAICLVLTAAAVALARRLSGGSWRTVVLRTSMGIVVALTVVTLVQHLTGWNLWVDELLVADTRTGVAGRMALTTVVSLLLIQAGMWLADRPGGYDLAQGCVCGGALVATFDGVGYVFGLQRTVDPGTYGVMAVHTSVSLVTVCLAFLFSRPHEGVMDAVTDPGPGGLVVRQLMPVVVGLPLVIAWLSWHGVRSIGYSSEFAITLVVTLSIVGLGLAMLAGSAVLRGFEEKRVAAETSRLQTDARLRRAVTEAPIPMVIHNGDQILNMSRAWALVSGFTLDDTPTLSAWVARTQRAPSAEMAHYLKQLKGATETVSGGEHPVRTREDDERVWEFSSTPLEHLGADEQLFVTTAIDVTRRKHAEADLRRVNEELEQRILDRTAELTHANDSLKRQSDQLREQALLLDLVRDGILVRDLYGTIIYWSAGAAEMYGWDKAHALGRVSHQLLAAEYPIPLAQIEEHVMQAGFWEGETIQVTQSGARLFVESRWTLTRTERGAPEGFLEVNRDITARRRVQDSLRDSELRFRAVAETAIEGIISLEASGTIRYWNPGAERLFGRPAVEAVGMAIGTVIAGSAIMDRLAPDGDPGIGTTFETNGCRKDGSEFPLEMSLSSWVNTQGGRVFTAIVRDITQHKQSERALEAKAEELTRSNQELEQFAYVASHDLQEPLRMVSNYTQLLAKRYKDQLDQDAHEFIDFAVDGAKRMQELIHDLLQYARVGTRGKEFRPVPVARVVADALANLAGAIDEAAADVVVDPLPTLSCDASQVAQVFQNLIGNAVKFRREGQRPVIRVSATRTDHAWMFTVQDNGIGIEPKYFERIFQMFQRLHTRGEYPGTGIGLALCKKIVERHGGRIRVESEPGRGTTFAFTLPDGLGVS
jgi:PAS domain S-box-containing protein